MSTGQMLSALGAEQTVTPPQQGAEELESGRPRGPADIFAIPRSGALLQANTRTVLELIRAEDWTVLGYGPLHGCMHFRPACARFLLLKDDGRPFLEQDSRAYTQKVLGSLENFMKANCKRTKGPLPELLPAYVKVLVQQPDMEQHKVCQSFYLALPHSRFPGLITALMLGQSFPLVVGEPYTRRTRRATKSITVNDWYMERPTDDLAGVTDEVAVYMQVDHCGEDGTWVPWVVHGRGDMITFMDLIHQALRHWGSQEPPSPVGPEPTPEALQRLAMGRVAAAVLEAWDFRSFKPADLPLPGVYLLVCMSYYGHGRLTGAGALCLPIHLPSLRGNRTLRLRLTQFPPGEPVSAADEEEYNTLWANHNRDFMPLAIYLEVAHTQNVNFQTFSVPFLLDAMHAHLAPIFTPRGLPLALQPVPPPFPGGPRLHYRQHENTEKVVRIFFAAMTYEAYQLFLDPTSARIPLLIDGRIVHRAHLGPHHKSVGCQPVNKGDPVRRLNPSAPYAARLLWLRQLPDELPAQSPYTPVRDSTGAVARSAPRQHDGARPRSRARGPLFSSVPPPASCCRQSARGHSPPPHCSSCPAHTHAYCPSAFVDRACRGGPIPHASTSTYQLQGSCPSTEPYYPPHLWSAGYQPNQRTITAHLIFRLAAAPPLHRT
jgi:hypothetical protein